MALFGLKLLIPLLTINVVKVNGFMCDDGCNITNSYYNDSWCDCVTCEDEPLFNCSTCLGGCPDACGPSATLCVTPSGNNTFICDDNCTIDNQYYNDSWCDCTNCEDEPLWTCLSCGGCPNGTCYDSIDCSFSAGVTTTLAADGYFECNDGCEINATYYNDLWCDCVTCEDEPLFNCSTCLGGCPDDVDECGVFAGLCVAPSGNNTFVCNDNCTIDNQYYDDGWCDCTQCEDEPDWTCTTCGGCPDNCYSSIDCGSAGGYTTTGVEIGTTAFGYFVCNDGCNISSSYYNDSWCDCITCEDEPLFNCTSCLGGCPDADECGVFAGLCVEPSGNNTFVCNDDCVIDNQYYNDSWCDCTECEDEPDWTCSACGGCPDNCYSSIDCSNGGGYTTTGSTTSDSDTDSDTDSDEGLLQQPCKVFIIALSLTTILSTWFK